MKLPIRDIHLPDAPSMWPPAIGWWLLAGLLLVLLAIGLHLLWHWRQQRARQTQIINGYDQLINTANSPEQTLQFASQYLRRVCLKHAPHAAHLADDAWLNFLDRTHGANHYFLTGEGSLLRDGPFQTNLNSATVASVVTEVRRVIISLVNDHA